MQNTIKKGNVIQFLLAMKKYKISNSKSKEFLSRILVDNNNNFITDNTNDVIFI